MKKSILNNVGKEVSFDFAWPAGDPLFGTILSYDNEVVKLKFIKYDGKFYEEEFGEDFIQYVKPLKKSIKESILKSIASHIEYNKKIGPKSDEGIVAYRTRNDQEYIDSCKQNHHRSFNYDSDNISVQIIQNAVFEDIAKKNSEIDQKVQDLIWQNSKKVCWNFYWHIYNQFDLHARQMIRDLEYKQYSENSLFQNIRNET